MNRNPVIKTDDGYIELRSKEAIKNKYNALTAEYLELRHKADKVKDQIDQISGLVEYEV